MILKKGLIRLALFFSLFSLYFAGYYIVLILVANTVGNEFSRVFTIPIRILLVLLMVLLFLYYPSFRLKKEIVLFFIFSAAYFGRVIYEIIIDSRVYSIPTNEYLFYFILYVFAPFVMTSQFKLGPKDYYVAAMALIISCGLLSLYTAIFYSHLIGEVGRFNISNEEKNYISPLALSYVSSLGIVVGLLFYATNKTRKIDKIIIFSSLIGCLVPFFLGASRGSLLAIMFIFLFYLYFSRGMIQKTRVILVVCISLILFFFSASYFGDYVLYRVLTIADDVESGSSSAIRLQYWMDSLEQFSRYPLFGNSLELDAIGFYPHNIYLEALITTGIIGFTPYVIFSYYIIKKCSQIIKCYPENSWITCIFLTGLTEGLFSGSIYASSWFAFGAGIVLSHDSSRKITP